jgi:hypothetical protein
MNFTGVKTTRGKKSIITEDTEGRDQNFCYLLEINYFLCVLGGYFFQ